MKIKLLTIVFLSLLLAGCSFAQLQKDPEALQSEEFVKGAVVKGFPSIPLPTSAKPIESYGRDKKYGASFISTDSLKKVVDFYSNGLAIGGWEGNLRQVSESNFVFDIKNPANAGTVIINTAADGKQTAITISLEPR